MVEISSIFINRVDCSIPINKPKINKNKGTMNNKLHEMRYIPKPDQETIKKLAQLELIQEVKESLIKVFTIV